MAALGHKPPLAVEPGDVRWAWKANVYECPP
jgi:hypothetical protein